MLREVPGAQVPRPWPNGRQLSGLRPHLSQNAIISEQGASWKIVLPRCHGLRTGGILENSTPKMPQFQNSSWTIKACLSFHKKSVVNRQNWGIMLRFHLFPRDLWERCSPRASKTVLGTRATLYVPRTVLEALGLHLSQDPSEEGGILAQYKFQLLGIYHYTPVLPVLFLSFPG